MKSKLVSLALLMITLNLYAVEGGYSNYSPGFYGDSEVAIPPSLGFNLRNDVYYYEASSTKHLKDNIIANLSLYEETYSLQNLISIFFTFNASIKDVILSIGLQHTLTDTLYKNVSTTLLQVSSKSESKTGFGDFTIIPLSVFFKQGCLYYNFSLSITAPTAKYNKNKSTNLGLNYWSYDNTLAVSYLNHNNNLELSVVPGIIYNTKNKTTNYHSGTEFHIDYMINKVIKKNLIFGLHGYYTDQIIKDKSRDILLNGIKTRASGLGPALIVNNIFNSKGSLITKWFYEYDSQNRIKKGHHFLLSLTYDI